MKVKVYCGETIEHLCGKQLHPVNEVKKALAILNLTDDYFVYSNSPDFVSAIKYKGEELNVETEFFLNGKSCGCNIDAIFEDFNRALIPLNTEE